MFVGIRKPAPKEGRFLSPIFVYYQKLGAVCCCGYFAIEGGESSLGVLNFLW